LLRNLAIGDVAGPGLASRERPIPKRGRAFIFFFFFFQNKTLEQLQAITLQLPE